MCKVKPSVTHLKWLSLTRSYGADVNCPSKLFYVECWELKNLTGWVLCLGIGRSPHPPLSFSLFPASMYTPTTMLFHLAARPETTWLRTLKCELNSSVPFNSFMPRFCFPTEITKVTTTAKLVPGARSGLWLNLAMWFLGHHEWFGEGIIW